MGWMTTGELAELLSHFPSNTKVVSMLGVGFKVATRLELQRHRISPGRAKGVGWISPVSRTEAVVIVPKGTKLTWEPLT